MALKYFKNNEYPNGFTLAEVLITLVIIGVIAAMTIPTLMKNTQNQEFVAGLKKANSTLQQAMLAIANNNDAAVGDYSFLNNVNFINELAKVTNVINKCNSLAACFGDSANTKYKKMNNALGGFGEGRGIQTNDGAIYYYVSSVANSQNHGIDPDDVAYSKGYIAVDVNGEKGPNTWGRDLFLFELLTNKGIVPCGYYSDATCANNSTGYGCTAKVLKENAMNY